MICIQDDGSLRLVGSEYIEYTDYRYIGICLNSDVTIYFKSMKYGSRRLPDQGMTYHLKIF
jgi:hypothetical protein